ncbi:MAG: DUF5693 family protein [Phycisphaeraceae bacterium]
MFRTFISFRRAAASGRRLALAALAAGLFCSPASGQDDQDLQQRVREMQAQLSAQSRQIAELQETRAQDWLDEKRKADVEALVEEVLADADSRAARPRAGWDGGFYLASPEDNFRLNLIGMVQGRYILGSQDEAAGPDGDDTTDGFEVSRTRAGFLGHVVDPSWQYVLLFGHSGHGDSLLLDAYVRKQLGDGWALTMGQFKLPFYREYLVSERYQQFVERSLVTYGFSCGYSQGVTLSHRGDDVAWAVTWSDGRSKMNSAWDADDAEWAVTGRADWKLAGAWADYEDYNGWPGQESGLLVLGGAVHAQAQESGPLAEELEEVRWTADLSWEGDGMNVFGAVVGTDQTGVGAVDAVGALVQGGWPAWIRAGLLAGGVIAQATILNSFSHYHTPLWISLQRSVIALALGILVGIVLIVVARVAVALVRRWLRAA